MEQLFPCYIFAFFDEGKQGPYGKVHAGCKICRRKENPLTVHPEIIQVIRDRMEGDFVAPRSEEFDSGERAFYGIFELYNRAKTSDEDLMRDAVFKPSTPLEEGMSRFVEWYNSYYGAG